MSVPAIRSEGAPPERHAARVVAEMCRWLAQVERSMYANMQEELNNHAGRLGNPKAMYRFAVQLSKKPKVNRLLLHVGIIPAKRGRGGFQFLTWKMVAPSGEDVEADKWIPAAPWLACTVNILWVRDQKASCVGTIATFTHHAMQRLAERCKARTIDDLLKALRAIALWIRDNHTEGATTLRIPVFGGTAIVEWAPEHGWLVKTVLPPDAEVFTQ